MRGNLIPLPASLWHVMDDLHWAMSPEKNLPGHIYNVSLSLSAIHNGMNITGIRGVGHGNQA